MVDLPNKIENSLESKEFNNLRETLDNIDNFEKDLISKQDLDNAFQGNLYDEIASEINKEITNLSSDENKITNNQESENSEVVNCLALTVKKDYNLAIVKNVMLKTLKNFWRIAVSVFTLNFLKYFLLKKY